MGNHYTGIRCPVCDVIRTKTSAEAAFLSGLVLSTSFRVEALHELCCKAHGDVLRAGLLAVGIESTEAA